MSGLGHTPSEPGLAPPGHSPAAAARMALDGRVIVAASKPVAAASSDGALVNLMVVVVGGAFSVRLWSLEGVGHEECGDDDASRFGEVLSRERPFNQRFNGAPRSSQRFLSLAFWG